MVGKIFAGQSDVDLGFTDLYGRFKMVEPHIQIHLDQAHPLRNILGDEAEISGSGTSSAYNETDHCLVMSVGALDGMRRLRTRSAGLHQANKNLLILFNANFNENLSLTWGINDLPKKGANDWNYENSSVTSLTVDSDKDLMAFIYLGDPRTGTIACGFIIDNIPIPVHTFSGDEVRDVHCPNLFPTFEIERSGGVITKRLGYMFGDEQIYLEQTNCTNADFNVNYCSIIGEGKMDLVGATYPISTGSDYRSKTGKRERIRPVIFFRLKPERINSKVYPRNATISIGNNGKYYMYLLKDVEMIDDHDDYNDDKKDNKNKNPVANNELQTYNLTWIDLPDKSIQYAYPPDNVRIVNVDKSAIEQDIGTKAQLEAKINFESVQMMGALADDTPEEWCLAVESLTAKDTIDLCLINLMELV